mgnify:CR=1 FL=1
MVMKNIEERNKKCKQDKIELLGDEPTELLCHNEAMYQLDEGIFCEFMSNMSDEEIYKLLSSRLGLLKVGLLETLNDTLFDPDLIQYLCGLTFVKKDSLKLYLQKNRLMSQVRNGFEVDYSNEKMKKVLQRLKK